MLTSTSQMENRGIRENLGISWQIWWTIHALNQWALPHDSPTWEALKVTLAVLFLEDRTRGKLFSGHKLCRKARVQTGDTATWRRRWDGCCWDSWPRVEAVEVTEREKLSQEMWSPLGCVGISETATERADEPAPWAAAQALHCPICLPLLSVSQN